MRGDFDYHHVTSGNQFLAIIIVILASVIGLAGLTLGLVLLTSIL